MCVNEDDEILVTVSIIIIKDHENVIAQRIVKTVQECMWSRFQTILAISISVFSVWNNITVPSIRPPVISRIFDQTFTKNLISVYKLFFIKKLTTHEFPKFDVSDGIRLNRREKVNSKSCKLTFEEW